MRVGSLFSGIGGIELGLERAGFNTVWFVENDKHAQAVLRKHWPQAVIYDDVTQLDFSTVPKINVLTGGFPCQDISTAGKRAGITGSRSSLWKYYVEAIRALRPQYIIAENVAALISYGLDTCLADLASIGYDAEWYCIPASSVGAPHQRDRIFIVAYPACIGCEQAINRKSIKAHALANSESGRRAEEREFRRDKPAERIASCCENVAYTQSARVQSNTCTVDEASRAHEEESEVSWRRSNAISCCSEDVAYTNSERQQEHNNASKLSEQKELGRGFDQESGWWAVEPDVGRVADGVPARVDRIKRLGNAVVPQVAQTIGEAIMMYMKEE